MPLTTLIAYLTIRALPQEDDGNDIYATYRPAKVKEGTEHPDAIVETASLASVVPPEISYQHHLQV